MLYLERFSRKQKEKEKKILKINEEMLMTNQA